MPLCVGQKIELDIHALISDGRGLARHEGLAVFVADALPGQRVAATVAAVKPRLAEAQLDAVLAAAPDARPALCPHSGLCGGCTWQAMPYAGQLAWKSRFVRDALERIGRISDPPVLPILPSPQEWGYRNKMEFAFVGHGTKRGGELSLGLRRRASHGIVDVTGCLLQTSLTMRVLEAVREAARRSGLAAWSRDKGGLWRFLVIREPAAGGCLVELIVAPHAAAVQQGQSIAEAVFADCPGVSGFIVSERAAPENIAYGERVRLALRQTELEEAYGGLRLHLGAGAFFQVNTPAAALLYAEAARLTALAPVHTIWDLYCGVGSVGLYLARSLRDAEPMPSILGVEQAKPAVELARVNAVSLGVQAVYHQGDAAKMIHSNHQAWGTPDLVVVDPPRAGLEGGLADSLLRLRPERIVYISCDQATLARDMARFAPQYRLEAVRPVDLFPQTPHVESVSLLVDKS